jgi:hypothetical protein
LLRGHPRPGNGGGFSFLRRTLYHAHGGVVDGIIAYLTNLSDRSLIAVG